MLVIRSEVIENIDGSQPVWQCAHHVVCQELRDEDDIQLAASPGRLSPATEEPSWSIPLRRRVSGAAKGAWFVVKTYIRT